VFSFWCETDEGVIEISIEARSEVFTIAKADREHLDEIRFWADFDFGQEIVLDVLARSVGNERIVFGVRSSEVTYMSVSAIIESRLQERRIIRYVMAVSFLIAAASLLLGVRHQKKKMTRL
jgi:hypothetical protein